MIKVTGIKEVSNWFNSLVKATSDSQPLFKDMDKQVIDLLNDEFSSKNTANWQDVSSEWASRKSSEGRGNAIGVYSGDLKRAATNDAIRTYTANTFTWKIADVKSIWFTHKRPVGTTVLAWLSNLGPAIIKNILSRIK